jgi:hypothetical protein
MHDYFSENKISTMTKVSERPKGAKPLHKYETEELQGLRNQAPYGRLAGRPVRQGA